MPLLPLEQFARVFGYNLWHLFGFSGGIVPSETPCNKALALYGYQDSDNASRTEIQQAIESAESLIKRYAGFAPAPHYGEETVDFSQVGYSGARYRQPSVRLSEGYVQDIGIQKLTVVHANAAVVYTDVDGDTLNDTFTITVATTETNPNNVRLYHSAANRFDGSDVGDRWQIRPISVRISGGNAIIKGGAWLMGVPVKYEPVNFSGLDPTVA